MLIKYTGKYVNIYFIMKKTFLWKFTGGAYLDLFLFETLLFPSYATRCRYDIPGGLASGSGLAASA